jgi:hypothetical protein
MHQVTAKIFASHKDNGNKSIIKKARPVIPNATAQAAFIRISAMTPALTALPIFCGAGVRMAFIKAAKIIQANESKK